MPNSEEILAANEKLRGDIKSFREDLTKVTTKEQHTRIIAYILIGAVVLLGGLGLFEKAENADERTRLVKEYLVNSCKVANQGRASEKSLWDTILLEDAKLSEKEGYKPSAAEKQALKRIEDTINKTYPQRNCEKVNDGEVVNLTPSPTP